MTPASNGNSARAAINRANSEHSTGPRTTAGKQRSSLNALRHGLTGHVVVLPTEDQTAYQRHLLRFVDQFQPKGALEEQLVQSLGDTTWRLNRVPATEATFLPSPPRTISTPSTPMNPEPREPWPWLRPSTSNATPSPTSAFMSSASPAYSTARLSSSTRSKPSAVTTNGAR
jgi:hypothetical protein